MSGPASWMVLACVALAPFVVAVGSWLVAMSIERRRRRRQMLTGLRAVVQRHRRLRIGFAVMAIGALVTAVFGPVSPTEAAWVTAGSFAAAAVTALVGGDRIALDSTELDRELRALLDEAA